MEEKKEHLLKLFQDWSGEPAQTYVPLPPSGSYREYYRIQSLNKTAIGAYNTDKKENIAFINFSKHFFSKGLNVPEIYREDLNKNVYLMRDLGDVTLFSYVTALRKDYRFPKEGVNVYKLTLEKLPEFQIIGGEGLNYNDCYPRSHFDSQSMMWDLNYFKYYFLKLAKVPFDEQKLEDDYQTFCGFLLKTKTDYFLYRDFQSRNVMLCNGEPYFIDYQGGRKGALQYDLASLLYDAKADLPNEVRGELLSHYIKALKNYIEVNEREFIEFFYGYALIRIMQAMGSYGFRGFYEKKEHFLKSIPYSLKNLEWILNNVELPIKVPTLITTLNNVVGSEALKVYSKPKSTLKITIRSFAYKKGIPADISGNGGGFVFDCRAINNPGKFEEYKELTGKDKQVIEFLEKHSEAQNFLSSVFNIIDISVENYLERKFTDLMINFGCTGGRHRSVYCAEILAKRLKNKYDAEVDLKHTEIE